QNWSDDQRTIIGLLNRIKYSSGGAGGSLDTKVINGICGAALYSAISRFEDKWFPGQRSGFVDPNGRMLRKIEDLAAPSKARAARSIDSTMANYKPLDKENPLRSLRENLLDDSSVRGKWTAGDQVQADRLAQMAVQYVDRLIAQGLKDIG